MIFYAYDFQEKPNGCKRKSAEIEVHPDWSPGFCAKEQRNYCQIIDTI